MFKASSSWGPKLMIAIGLAGSEVLNCRPLLSTEDWLPIEASQAP